MTAQTTRKPARKASAVRTLTVAPEALSGADLGAASLPQEILDALAAGQAAIAAIEALKPVRKVRQCLTPPAAYRATLDDLGWRFYPETLETLKPSSNRANVTANSAVYASITELLKVGTATVWNIALLYDAKRDREKNILSLKYIMQRVANYAGKVVEISGDKVRFC
jgi:hypothetical protein